jgi:predicted TIM-barrel fold metal-dependent hydrolase
MKSLVVLMMEEEQPEGISARKLVVETAKHNVITGYGADTGLDLLKRFPNVDAILVHSSILERHETLLTTIKSHAPGVPIILAHPFGYPVSREATYLVDSHNPQQLLELLTDTIFPLWSSQPAAT